MDPGEDIHLFVPKFRVDETLAEIRVCLERGWTGLGYKTLEFEEEWKRYTGLPHAHHVSSATAGLHLAVRLLKESKEWAEGDEVITTPFTFVSTNHVLLYERLQPVFADIDEYLCLDPASVRARLTPRTRAVMFVGIAGNCGRLGEVAQLCEERGLSLILDAAHMSGTYRHGRHVGMEADVSVFSFHSVKNLPTADSGMICFRDPAMDREVRKWSWLGINKDTYARTAGEGPYRWRYDVDHVGFKYHGNSIMAAIALVALRHLEEDNQTRRDLAHEYDRHLAGAEGLEGIPVPEECLPSRHLYQVLVSHRDAVIEGLNSQGVFPGVHYQDNTQYPMYRFAAGTCPRAHAASDRVISLPLHLGLGAKDVERIAASLSRAIRMAADSELP